MALSFSQNQHVIIDYYQVLASSTGFWLPNDSAPPRTRLLLWGHEGQSLCLHPPLVATVLHLGEQLSEALHFGVERGETRRHVGGHRGLRWRGGWGRVVHRRDGFMRLFKGLRPYAVGPHKLRTVDPIAAVFEPFRAHTTALDRSGDRRFATSDQTGGLSYRERSHVRPLRFQGRIGVSHHGGAVHRCNRIETVSRSR